MSEAFTIHITSVLSVAVFGSLPSAHFMVTDIPDHKIIQNIHFLLLTKLWQCEPRCKYVAIEICSKALVLLACGQWVIIIKNVEPVNILLYIDIPMSMSMSISRVL